MFPLRPEVDRDVNDRVVIVEEILRHRSFVITVEVLLRVGHFVVLLAMSEHAVFEGELSSTNVTGERPLARVSPHVSSQIFCGPESS